MRRVTWGLLRGTYENARSDTGYNVHSLPALAAKRSTRLPYIGALIVKTGVGVTYTLLVKK